MKQQKKKTFDFKQEMHKYCQSDVDILRRGCMKLRELFIEIADIDPFRYITIASVCHAIYRSWFLPVNTIGIADEAQVDTHSVKSIKWLEYIAQKENIRIRHACNEGEQCIMAKHTRSTGIAKIQKRSINFTDVTGTGALCVTTN